MMLYFAFKYNLIRAILYLRLFKKRGYGAEIGVWKGWNAKLIYYLTRPKELVLIDPYAAHLCNAVYQPVPSQEEMDKMYNVVRDWTVAKPILLFREPSEDMSRYIYTGKLDWIYIDGDHFNVYQDLSLWYDNIKTGGIIMGDDYGVKGYPKVKEDVDRFCSERGLKLHKLHFQYWFKK